MLLVGKSLLFKFLLILQFPVTKLFSLDEEDEVFCCCCLDDFLFIKEIFAASTDGKTSSFSPLTEGAGSDFKYSRPLKKYQF